MWFVCKTTFYIANAARIRADSVRGKSGQTFGKFAGAAAQQQNPFVGLDTTLPRDAQMTNTMAVYMDNLTKAAGVNYGTFTAVNECLAESTATFKSLAEPNALFAANIAEQSKELRSLRQQLNRTKQSGGSSGSSLRDSRVASWAHGK